MRSTSKSILQAAAVLLFLPTMTIRAQEAAGTEGRFFVTIGVGADAHGAPSYIDQVNEQVQPSEFQRLGKVLTAIDLSVMPEYAFAPHWSAAIEYALLFNSHEATGANGTLEYNYTVHMPTALVHYVVQGDGFWWKAGGGLGYHLASLSQKFRGIDMSFDGTAHGPALKLDAMAGTSMAPSVYGTAAVEFRAAFLGSLRDGNGTPLRVSGHDVNLQFYSFGLKLGLTVAL
jgi:hypothetical protein